MITFTKSVENFEDIISELIRVKYSDDIIGDFSQYECVSEVDFFKSYREILEYVVNYTSTHLPGMFNNTYPNCINLTLNAFGFRYMKDNIGIGITEKYSGKLDKVLYTISFSFNREEKFLKNNPIFVALSEDEDYEMKNIVHGKNRKPTQQNTTPQE